QPCGLYTDVLFIWSSFSSIAIHIIQGHNASRLQGSLPMEFTPLPHVAARRRHGLPLRMQSGRRSGERGIWWRWTDYLPLVCHLDLFTPNFSRFCIHGGKRTENKRTQRGGESKRELSLESDWMFASCEMHAERSFSAGKETAVPLFQTCSHSSFPKEYKPTKFLQKTYDPNRPLAKMQS
ncbi:hypothetical protein U9M48_011963, partial [Paspalum notatum var. saurae]